MISELFRAESKSQVYESLHQYFSDYPSVLDKLGTYDYVYVGTHYVVVVTSTKEIHVASVKF